MTIASVPNANTIAPELVEDFLKLNSEQQKVVEHDQGPLLVIAGPGSGKTHCLTLLAMNLLLLKKAKPSELILCTYTAKAAYEMQDRISDIAKRVGYNEDIAQMRIGTIHSICHRIIVENLHRIPNSVDQSRPILGNNFEILDQLSQRLFIFEQLDQICKASGTFFNNRWGTEWEVAKKLKDYFDKITEELIDANALRSQRNYFLMNLADAYRNYQALLEKHNCLDFAHLQKTVYGLLKNPKIAEYIRRDIRFVLVDEYQDTNFIQEQILYKLSANTNNIFVVGDEDQSIYRFRGATGQNIRRFQQISRIKREDVIFLKLNYRSESIIIDRFNSWMNTVDWRGCRSDKQIYSRTERKEPAYPSVLLIVGKDVEDEADQFAEFVALLKEQGTITDYNQVALLLYSVKWYGSPYVKALKKKGIQFFCSRDGSYFIQDEVRLMVGCLSYILNISGMITRNCSLNDYLKDTQSRLRDICETNTILEATLHEFELEIAQLSEEKELHKQLIDYFYHLIAIEPFATWLKDVEDTNQMRNLVIFSELLQTFQRYYHYEEITFDNWRKLAMDFFTKFLSILYEDGSISQFENPEQPFPAGCVPIITIHQAKGLEFPVVVVGSLNRKIPDLEAIDKELQRFYLRSKPDSKLVIRPEPVEFITTFDFLRLYYVAFSRAKHLLVLTGNQHNRPSSVFKAILLGLPQWRQLQSHLPNIGVFSENKWIAPKSRYSFTQHIRMYETCPRQYQFYREFKFVPSRQEDTFLGLLVHQTIEKIHRIVLDNGLANLNDIRLRELFDQTFSFLSQTNRHPIGVNEIEKAFEHVLNYFINNRLEMQYITKVEEHISVVKNDYVLTAAIDLILERNDTIEILDFKTSRRPGSNDLEAYERQLYMYAHALEQQGRKMPKRLLLYWTEEPIKEKALIVFPCHAERVNEVVAGFNDVVDHIKAKQFNVVVPPEARVCNKCDFRNLCIRDGLIAH